MEINLSETQYKLIKSEAFKKWFGDWERVIKAKENDPSIDDTTLSLLKYNVSEAVDYMGYPMVYYHGTNYHGEITKFKENWGVIFLSTDPDFAYKYAEDKAFAQGTDYEPTIYSLFVNTKRIFDTFNKEHVDLLATLLPDKFRTGWGNPIEKSLFIDKLLGNEIIPPYWSKEKIDSAVFGQRIGEAWDGYNTDVFIGIDDDDNVVYVQNTNEEYLKFLTPEQINVLISGEPVSVEGYVVYGNLYSLDELKEAVASGIVLERDMLHALNYKLRAKIHPYKKSQKTEYLTNQDNWQYLELTDIDIPEIIKSLGFDGIYIQERGVKNLIVFKSNQLKRADGINTTFDSDNPDIRFGRGGNLSKTPAPEEERIKGSLINKKASASSEDSAKNIVLSDRLINTIENKIKGTGISLEVAKAVVRRGMGAYSVSHRPTITGGKKNSRTAWGLARLNAFIYKAKNGFSKSGKYNQDDDLFEDLGIQVANYADGGIVAFNRKIRNEQLETWKIEYDSVEEINSRVAFSYLQDLALKHYGEVQEIDWINRSKRPKNYFQLEMYLGDIILKTNPFIYVDDNHKVIQAKTNVEVLNGNYDTVKNEIKLERGGIIAPNGKTSNLNEVQWKLVRTAEFKKWFGDWENDPENSSKVIDENGEPMVVYHGTWQEFNVFEINKEGGWFFTEFRRIAQIYADTVRFGKGSYKNENPRVVPAFLNIRKINIKDFHQKVVQRLSPTIKSSKKAGYDGLLIKNGLDVGGYYDQYVVFSPNQIKLADGTNTTFDYNNRDIRYDNGGIIEKYEKYTQDLAEKIREFGYDTTISYSRTDFGISHYIYVRLTPEDFNNFVKIRISDHDVQNIDRIRNEEHLSFASIHDDINGTINGLLKSIRFRLERSKYFIEEDAWDTKITVLETSKINPNDEILSERESSGRRGKKGRKIYMVIRKTPVPVTNIVYIPTGKVYAVKRRAWGLDSPTYIPEYKDGGVISEEQSDTYKKWSDLVNMTASELNKFVNTKEGKEAGLSKKEADELGIKSGRESAKWIIKMKGIPYKKWTSEMWEWANRQIRFISRMSKAKGSLFNEKGEKTRKHTSLLIWGHNPLKYNNGGLININKQYPDYKLINLEYNGFESKSIVSAIIKPTDGDYINISKLEFNSIVNSLDCSQLQELQGLIDYQNVDLQLIDKYEEGGAIQKYNVSASVANAIKDLESFYVGSPLQLGIIYNMFKNYEDLDVVEYYDGYYLFVTYSGSEFNKQILKSLFGQYIEYEDAMSSNWDFGLNEDGVKFINAVRERVRTRKALKEGTFLFPEYSGIENLELKPTKEKKVKMEKKKTLHNYKDILNHLYKEHHATWNELNYIDNIQSYLNKKLAVINLINNDLKPHFLEEENDLINSAMSVNKESVKEDISNYNEWVKKEHKYILEIGEKIIADDKNENMALVHEFPSIIRQHIIDEEVYFKKLAFDPFKTKDSVPLKWSEGISIFDNKEIPLSIKENLIGKFPKPVFDKKDIIVEYKPNDTVKNREFLLKVLEPFITRDGLRPYMTFVYNLGGILFCVKDGHAMYMLPTISKNIDTLQIDHKALGALPKEKYKDSAYGEYATRWFLEKDTPKIPKQYPLIQILPSYTNKNLVGKIFLPEFYQYLMFVKTSGLYDKTTGQINFRCQLNESTQWISFNINYLIPVIAQFLKFGIHNCFLYGAAPSRAFLFCEKELSDSEYQLAENPNSIHKMLKDNMCVLLMPVMNNIEDPDGINPATLDIDFGIELLWCYDITKGEYFISPLSEETTGLNANSMISKLEFQYDLKTFKSIRKKLEESYHKHYLESMSKSIIDHLMKIYIKNKSYKELSDWEKRLYISLMWFRHMYFGM